uniref:ankyrin repeat domain-containing protein 10a isoform X4 n=1 Tax=Monopterus albus TaxID=43700 RepID=UPI0009B38A3D|nr:ankyrin repeat domain-containing protein 10-like isoform X4 [Monopterus albus]
MQGGATGELDCVVHLVQMGCEVNTTTSRFNQTPSHTAAFGGQPHCLVWLTQAGADVNRQDFVGEAPIHKAARSGSLECIQVLLIAGAKPHLRNTSGQTAADLAHAHGFLDCFRFISNAQKHLLQLGGLHVNGEQNGNAPYSQRALSRKRQLTAMDSIHMKKARKAENDLVQMHSSAGEEEEEEESMTAESVQERNLADDTEAIANSHRYTLPYAAQDHTEQHKILSLPSPSPASQHAAAVPAQHSSADMCGSLHLSSSPSSCVSHRPAWWGPIGSDCGSPLHYGHYHGFGDTAEELGDSSCLKYSSSIQAEHRYMQAVASTVHLQHSS